MTRCGRFSLTPSLVFMTCLCVTVAWRFKSRASQPPTQFLQCCVAKISIEWPSNFSHYCTASAKLHASLFHFFKSDKQKVDKWAISFSRRSIYWPWLTQVAEKWDKGPSMQATSGRKRQVAGADGPRGPRKKWFAVNSSQFQVEFKLILSIIKTHTQEGNSSSQAY